MKDVGISLKPTIMKKLFLSAAIIALSSLMFSCSSNDPIEKFKDYQKEIAEYASQKDIDKMKETAEEYDKWYNNLSSEDKEKVDQYINENKEQVESALKGAQDAMKLEESAASAMGMDNASESSSEEESSSSDDSENSSSEEQAY